MRESALLSGCPEPTSLAYAISKHAGMQKCLAYNQQYGEKRFISVIPNSAYRPNDNFDPQSGHVLFALIRRFHEAKLSGAGRVTLWGSGSPRREFVHADGIAAACLHLLRQDVLVESPLNIGVSVDISIRKPAETIAGVVGYIEKLDWDTTKPNGAPRKLLDSLRLRSLGWNPAISFDTGLRDTYDWYLKNRALAMA